MTQPLITGQPIIAPTADAGEPTMEQLAAMVGDPLPDPLAESNAAAPAPATEAAATDAPEVAANEEGKAPAPPAEPVAEPTEVDAAAARAAKAAAAARAGSRRFAEMKAQQAEAQAAVQRAAREAEQLRQENAAAKAEREAYKKDPYKALKDAGMTDRDLAERALRENTPEAEMVRIRERLDASEAARVALEKRIEDQAETARRQSIVARAEADFTATADNEAAFPELSRLTSEGQLANARLALARIEANGHSTRHLTTTQIAEAAEKYIVMTRKAKAAASAPPVAKPPVAAAKPSGATLTNKQAQTRTVAPAEWDSLSDEQQMAHIASLLPDPT